MHWPPQQLVLPPKKRERQSSSREYSRPSLIPAFSRSVSESRMNPPLSSRTEDIPVPASSRAIAMPAAPAPTMATSVSIRVPSRHSACINEHLARQRLGSERRSPSSYRQHGGPAARTESALHNLTSHSLSTRTCAITHQHLVPGTMPQFTPSFDSLGGELHGVEMWVRRPSLPSPDPPYAGGMLVDGFRFRKRGFARQKQQPEATKAGLLRRPDRRPSRPPRLRDSCDGCHREPPRNIGRTVVLGLRLSGTVEEITDDPDHPSLRRSTSVSIDWRKPSRWSWIRWARSSASRIR